MSWLLAETIRLVAHRDRRRDQSGARTDAKLKPPVPLHWVYVTGWATADGVVQFRDDIYNRDGLNSALRPRRAADILMIAAHASQTARTPFARLFGNAYLVLALASLCWSGNHLLGRAIAGHVPPLTITTLRWLLAARSCFRSCADTSCATGR